MLRRDLLKSAAACLTLVGFHKKETKKPHLYLFEADENEHKALYGLTTKTFSVDPFQAMENGAGSILHVIDAKDYTLIKKVDATDMLRSYSRWCALKVCDLFWGPPSIVRRWLETGDPAIYEEAEAEALNNDYKITRGSMNTCCSLVNNAKSAKATVRMAFTTQVNGLEIQCVRSSLWFMLMSYTESERVTYEELIANVRKTSAIQELQREKFNEMVERLIA